MRRLPAIILTLLLAAFAVGASAQAPSPKDAAPADFSASVAHANV